MVGVVGIIIIIIKIIFSKDPGLRNCKQIYKNRARGCSPRFFINLPSARVLKSLLLGAMLLVLISDIGVHLYKIVFLLVNY